MCDIDVKELRKKLKLSQEMMGELVGVSLRTIQNWEKGKKIPETRCVILRKISDEQNKVIIEKSIKSNILSTDSGIMENVLKMYQNGEIYSASQVDNLIAKFENLITKLQEENQQLKDEIKRLGGGDNPSSPGEGLRPTGTD